MVVEMTLFREWCEELALDSRSPWPSLSLLKPSMSMELEEHKGELGRGGNNEAPSWLVRRLDLSVVERPISATTEQGPTSPPSAKAEEALRPPNSALAEVVSVSWVQEVEEEEEEEDLQEDLEEEDLEKEEDEEEGIKTLKKAWIEKKRWRLI